LSDKDEEGNLPELATSCKSLYNSQGMVSQIYCSSPVAALLTSSAVHSSCGRSVPAGGQNKDTRLRQ
jgi:hypothetical protein